MWKHHTYTYKEKIGEMKKIKHVILLQNFTSLFVKQVLFLRECFMFYVEDY